MASVIPQLREARDKLQSYTTDEASLKGELSADEISKIEALLTKAIDAKGVDEQSFVNMSKTVNDKAVRITRVRGMADSFKVSAVLGIFLGLFCFRLPHTPPQKGESKFAAGEAFREIQKKPLLILFLVAFPVSCIHQFYFVLTEQFLGTQGLGQMPLFQKIFGVGGGPMTIGQISELAVLACMPFIAVRLARKWLLSIGLIAYILRFAIFAYLPSWSIPALALHGVCFGFFFFVAFMVVDEETTTDVGATAQSLFNLIVLGLGVIFGNLAAGIVGEYALMEDGKTMDYSVLFGMPMWVAVACLVFLLLFYPAKSTHKTTLEGEEA